MAFSAGSQILFNSLSPGIVLVCHMFRAVLGQAMRPPAILMALQISGIKLARGLNFLISVNTSTQSISPSWICNPSPSTPLASARCKCPVKGRIVLRNALNEAFRGAS